MKERERITVETQMHHSLLTWIVDDNDDDYDGGAVVMFGWWIVLFFQCISLSFSLFFLTVLLSSDVDDHWPQHFNFHFKDKCRCSLLFVILNYNLKRGLFFVNKIEKKLFVFRFA